MKVKRIIHIAFVVALILVSAYAVTPASAKEPTHYEIPVDWSGRVVNECGFHIYATTLGTQRSTFWYDENGYPEKGFNFFTITTSWDAGGNILEFEYNYAVHGEVQTYPEYYVVWLGIEPIVTLPGSGAVIKYAGYSASVWTMDKKGNLDYEYSVKDVGVVYADWDVICEYLAPPGK